MTKWTATPVPAWKLTKQDDQKWPGPGGVIALIVLGLIVLGALSGGSDKEASRSNSMQTRPAIQR